jgi:hypothetical protein
MFKQLYGNSGRQQGTLRYYREKLQRRNVTCDIKHYEDCEQLFISVGKSFIVAAILDFFHMKSIDDSPTKHRPPFHNIHLGNNKECYFQDTLGTFVDEYLIPSKKAGDSRGATPERPEIDYVKEYSLCLLRYYFLLSSIKDAVKVGDGDRLAILHKELLAHFKSVPGFNAYAIEMLVNVLQNSVLLSEAEAHTCRWASKANWKGGAGKNIEMDLLQENSNRDIKKHIKSMGANKTEKSIERMSRASGGLRSIVDNFDDQVGKKCTSSSHSHKVATNDEKLIIEDLQKLQPFTTIPGRKHKSFHKASSDPLATLDQEAFHAWLKKHQKNMLFNIPSEEDDEDDEEDEE